MQTQKVLLQQIQQDIYSLQNFQKLQEQLQKQQEQINNLQEQLRKQQEQLTDQEAELDIIMRETGII